MAAATILWTNVKEIFTTATYRQLMKTTPNWLPICCHQLTLRLRLLSARPHLPAYLPSACQHARSMSSPGLLFKPAKHIKLILALRPRLLCTLLGFLLVFRCNSCGSMCKFNQSACLRMLQCSQPQSGSSFMARIAQGAHNLRNLIKCIGFLLD